MSRYIRGPLIGLCALAALSITAATAASTGTLPVRINTSATTTTATNSTVTLNTASGQRLYSCRTWVASATIGSSGDVNINSSAFNTCTFSGITMSVTPSNLPWTGVLRHLDNAAGNPTAVTLDAGVRNSAGTTRVVLITFAYSGCTYVVTGSLLGSTSISAAHNVLATLGGITFPSPLSRNPLSLTVLSTAGSCALQGIAVGNTLSISTGIPLTFAPAVVGAAI